MYFVTSWLDWTHARTNVTEPAKMNPRREQKTQYKRYNCHLFELHKGLSKLITGFFCVLTIHDSVIDWFAPIHKDESNESRKLARKLLFALGRTHTEF
jgi:hypothetical protein